MKPISRSIKEG